jgi:hypothetical protein
MKVWKDFFWNEGELMGKDFLKWDFLMEGFLAVEESKGRKDRIMFF